MRAMRLGLQSGFVMFQSVSIVAAWSNFMFRIVVLNVRDVAKAFDVEEHVFGSALVQQLH